VAVIILQPCAKADLVEIWEFIADDSDTQADAFIDLIDQKFQLLARQSGLGRRRDELAEGLRSFPVGRYVIFYLAIPGGVKIVRVLHGARDIEVAFTEQEA
jgi:toxin ParE1/3/4